MWGGNAASRVADGSGAFELGLNADMALQVAILGQHTIGVLSQAHGKPILRSRRQQGILCTMEIMPTLACKAVAKVSKRRAHSP